MTFDEFFQRAHARIPIAGARAVLALVAEGATLPFIARFRTDRIGDLAEADVLAVAEAKERYDALRERQRFVCEEIARQGKLVPELRATVESTFDRDVLDDLYAPFKRKRRTPGVIATEAGLGPLADWLWNCSHGLDTPLPGQTLELWAFTFRDEAQGVADTAAAIAGAEAILVERLAEMGGLRARVREAFLTEGWLHASRGERGKDGGRFAALFDLHEPVAAFLDPANAARYLTLRRGVNEGELRVRLDAGADGGDLDARLRALVAAEACPTPDVPGADVLHRAASRAFEEHLWPAAEAAVHRALRIVADEHAVGELMDRLRTLVLAPPLGPRVVLGVDPAPRGGSKIAVVDAAGTPLEQAVLHADGDEKRARAAELLADLAARHGIEAVAVGDGTASKEIARFVRALLRERGVLVPVVVVSEAGAASWAASDAARGELPALDPGARAAVAIARRLQDPLAECLRGDPRQLVTGGWVHDVSQPRLERAVEVTVAACVADVGVDVNAAPEHVLARVPGLGPGLAHAIVEHRAAHGPFASRAAVRVVPLVDVRAWEQVAAFLRVYGGEHPLDASAVHPEQYDAIERLAGRLGRPVGELCGDGAAAVAAAGDLEPALGPPARLVAALRGAGRDPRGRLDPVEFHPGVRTLAELTPGLACPGVVTSVTSFGAFVDIGLPHDGLVHVSRLAAEFVKDPHAVVQPGDRVRVRVVDVNREKQQIALSMKPEPPAREDAPRRHDVPRRHAPRDEAPRRHGPQAATKRQSDPRRERPKSREPAFNNPFADLASQLRGGGGRSSGPSKPPSS